MRIGKLEHLVTTGTFEGKRSRGRQREKIMDGLATWLGTGQVLDTLAAVKESSHSRGNGVEESQKTLMALSRDRTRYPVHESQGA
ncbi:hypothetical protein PoB_005975600 [Plakobranchus ocellatus]|uniref:Uncharacterized protein n=1 Tax=Plakobranchus ocellatus TaxID=259542 RepID=A0AAV4CD51_9GAST|nr:hypothetical protein PoB_005975600 [Plakobranchus ocellatus]